MSLARSLFLTGVALACAVAFGASAAETTPAPSVQLDKPAKAVPAPKVKVKKKMKMDEPMDGGMKKPGMMKGDVKKAADEKAEKTPVSEDRTPAPH